MGRIKNIIQKLSDDVNAELDKQDSLAEASLENPSEAPAEEKKEPKKSDSVASKQLPKFQKFNKGDN